MANDVPEVPIPFRSRVRWPAISVPLASRGPTVVTTFPGVRLKPHVVESTTVTRFPVTTAIEVMARQRVVPFAMDGAFRVGSSESDGADWGHL